jgi:hypothetical protein
VRGELIAAYQNNVARRRRRAGSAEGMTFAEAFAVRGDLDLARLRKWFELNTGPSVEIDPTPVVGTVTISNQAGADALVGKRVIGKIVIDAADIELRDFIVDWDHSGTGTLLLELANGVDGAHIHHFLLDGHMGNVSYGLGGTTFSENLLVEYGEIRQMGGDAIRTHKNSTYRWLYCHSFRNWVESRDGVFNWDGDQSIFPHPDVIQTIRSGNLVEECFFDISASSTSTSVCIIKPDADEQINGFTMRRCVVDGGGATFYIDNANSNIDNPGANGQPINLVFEDILVGRKYRDTVWRHGEVPSANITKTNIRYIDDLSPVEDFFLDDFNRTNENLEARNFDRVSGVAGQLAINTNQVQSVSIAAQGTYLLKETYGVDPVDHFVEADWKSGTTTGWLIARYVDEQNYVGMQILASAPAIYARINNVFYLQGSSAASLTAGDKVRIECRGQQVDFYHKGVLRKTFTLPAGVLTSGRVGLQSRTTVANPMCDNFAAGTLQGGSQTPAVPDEAPPAPTLPDVVQATTGVDTTNGTTVSFTLPAVIAAGTQGVIAVKTGATITFSAIPAGWELVDEDVAIASGMRVYKKTAPFAGTEGGTTLSWTASGATLAAFAFIEVANSIGQVDTEYTAALDPPSVSPTGGADDTVIFAVSAIRRTDNDCTAPPTNYTGATPLMSETAAANTSSGHVAMAAAYRELSTAAENPGAFTWTGTLTIDPQSVTIAIR